MTKAEAKPYCAPQLTTKCEGLTGATPPIAHIAPDYGLIAINAGTSTMGASDGPHPEDGEGPPRQVTLDAFSIAPLTVTNAQFGRFVRETGYATVAEQTGASFVFEMLLPDDTKDKVPTLQAPWWCEVVDACWHLPEGPKGQPTDQRLDHPVVHIAPPDALAYCSWAGALLPSEAQWEYTARGGPDAQPFPWGGDSLSKMDSIAQPYGKANSPTQTSRKTALSGLRPQGATPLTPTAFTP